MSDPVPGPTAGTFGIAEAAQLAVVTRSGFVESRHSGSAVVLSPEGETLVSLGDPAAPILPRSCLKPLQALAVLGTGVTLDAQERAMAMASHSGTAEHVRIVRRMLAGGGLDESALGCPPDWPGDSTARTALAASGAGPAPVYMNCSGKHAAMLRACVQEGWETGGYLDPGHPLQQRIRETVQRFTGERVTVTAVDGCGAPVHGVSLVGLAGAVRRLRMSSPASPFPVQRQAAELVAAALGNGWIIEGPGRPNSIVIDELGVLAKLGAEGVMVMAAPDGTTVAVKILDGSARAGSVVALDLLASVGAVPVEAAASVVSRLGLEVHGGGRAVGRVSSTV